MSEIRALLQQVQRHAIISATDLAEAAGISYNTWRSWQVGRRNPSPRSLRSVAKALRDRGSTLHGLAVQVGHERARSVGDDEWTADSTLEQVARLLEAVADPLRLRILLGLRLGVGDPNSLARMLGADEGRISDELEGLRDQGIVALLGSDGGTRYRIIHSLVADLAAAVGSLVMHERS